MPPYKKTFEYAQSTEPGHGPIYRSFALEGGYDFLRALPNGGKTLYHSLQNAIKQYGPNICFGSRCVINNIEEVKEIEKKVDGKVVKEKKTWTYYQMSPYEWVTYNELSQNMDDIGSALKYIGLGFEKRLALFAPTSHYWTTMVNACYTQNICAITVYDTLGSEGLKHGLNECEIPVIFITPEQIGTLEKILSEVPTLTHIILTEELPSNKVQDLKAIQPEIQLYSFVEFIELGKVNHLEHNPPNEEDECLIMYTSGTTGNPKGVVITHSNVVSIVSGALHLISPYLKPEDDVYLSFLPLAHILAFAVDCLFLNVGLRIAYGSPRTLTDISVRNCLGDIREAAPTLLVGVPQVYDMIRKTILNRVNNAGAIVQNVFGASVQIKQNFTRYGFPTFLLDSLVFKRVHDQLGGRLRYAVCGGAPISSETREFFTASVCELFQGYGLTEVCGLAFACTPDIYRANNIGQVSPSLEFKLVDVPEIGYFHTNCPPQGELWFRGPAVAKGYFKNKEATEEAFTEDGWFKTGDIVTYEDNGTLSIVDRKKNLAKLANGEYIALEKLESNYKNVLYVQNICVVVNSEKNRPVGLVQVGLEAINHFAKSVNRETVNDLEDVSKRQDFHDEVLKAIQCEAKKAGFNTSEIIIDVYLTPIEWTPENDLVTTSQKLKRKNLATKFDDALQAMYKKF